MVLTKEVDMETDTILQKKIGKTFYDRRRLLGITQQELAKKISTSPKEVWKMENGTNMTLKSLRKFAEALQLNLDIVLNDIPNTK